MDCADNTDSSNTSSSNTANADHVVVPSVLSFYNNSNNSSHSNADPSAATGIPNTASAAATTAGLKRVSKTFSDGSHFEGLVCPVTRRRTGHGLYRNPAGDCYDGDWRADRRHGLGRYSWANGDCYTGGWAGDRMHGEGTFVWACGDSYTGQWEQGKMQGHGRRELANGDVYEGGWVADKSSGHGYKVRSDLQFVFLHVDDKLFVGSHQFKNVCLILLHVVFSHIL